MVTIKSFFFDFRSYDGSISYYFEKPVEGNNRAYSLGKSMIHTGSSYKQHSNARKDSDGGSTAYNGKYIINAEKSGRRSSRVNPSTNQRYNSPQMIPTNDRRTTAVDRPSWRRAQPASAMNSDYNTDNTHSLPKSQPIYRWRSAPHTPPNDRSSPLKSYSNAPTKAADPGRSFSPHMSYNRRSRPLSEYPEREKYLNPVSRDTYVPLRKDQTVYNDEKIKPHLAVPNINNNEGRASGTPAAPPPSKTGKGLSLPLVDRTIFANLLDIITPSKHLTAIQKISLRRLREPFNELESYIITSQTGTGKTLVYLSAIMDNIVNSKQHGLLRSFSSELEGYRDQSTAIARQYQRTFGIFVSKKGELGFMEKSTSNIQSLVNCYFPKAIVVDQTNFLARQTYEVAKMLSASTNMNIHLVTSAAPFAHHGIQDIDILITTPLSLNAHIGRGLYKTSLLRYLVIDNADYSRLDRKNDAIIKIIEKIRSNQERSESLVEKAPLRVLFVGSTISKSTYSGIHNLLPHTEVMSTHNVHKLPNHFTYDLMSTKSSNTKNKLTICKEALKLKCVKSKVFLIFCNTIESAETLTDHLRSIKYKAQLVSPKIPLSEQARIAKVLSDKSLSSLERKLPAEHPPQIYVSSGIFSFGLDTVGVDHVILYDIPRTRADLINKLGRVARSGQHGYGTILISENESHRFSDIMSYSAELIP